MDNQTNNNSTPIDDDDQPMQSDDPIDAPQSIALLSCRQCDVSTCDVNRIDDSAILRHVELLSMLPKATRYTLTMRELRRVQRRRRSSSSSTYCYRWIDSTSICRKCFCSLHLITDKILRALQQRVESGHAQYEAASQWRGNQHVRSRESWQEQRQCAEEFLRDNAAQTIYRVVDSSVEPTMLWIPDAVASAVGNAGDLYRQYAHECDESGRKALSLRTFRNLLKAQQQQQSGRRSSTRKVEKRREVPDHASHPLRIRLVSPPPRFAEEAEDDAVQSIIEPDPVIDMFDGSAEAMYNM